MELKPNQAALILEANDEGEISVDMAAQDMDGLAACDGGTVADGDTDENGMTQWQEPLEAGGYTDIDGGELTVVIVSGDALTMPGMDVQHNSADISGDGVANLTDIAAFTQVLMGAYEYLADFIWDGVVNLSDVALMSQGNGTACP